MSLFRGLWILQYVSWLLFLVLLQSFGGGANDGQGPAKGISAASGSVVDQFSSVSLVNGTQVVSC